MKRVTLIAMLLAMLALTGCRRSDSNGEIDGFWRVVSYENREDGKVTEVGNRYIGIQLELFQLKSPTVTGVMDYDKDSGKLVVDFRDPNPIPAGSLELYGIYENPAVFDVDFPSHKEMLLTSSKTVIKCQRW